MYFIKDSFPDRNMLNDENFEKKIQYGTISGNVMESLLRLMQGVYVPMFMENKQWPESVRKVFLTVVCIYFFRQTMI